MDPDGFPDYDPNENYDQPAQQPVQQPVDQPVRQPVQQDDLEREARLLNTNNIDDVLSYAKKVLRDLKTKNIVIRQLREKNDMLLRDKGSLEEQVRRRDNVIEQQKAKIIQLSQRIQYLDLDPENAETQGKINAYKNKIARLEGSVSAYESFIPDREYYEDEIKKLKAENDQLQLKLKSLEDVSDIRDNYNKLVFQVSENTILKKDIKEISDYGLELIREVKRFKNYSDEVAEWYNKNMGRQFYVAFLHASENETELLELVHSTLYYIDLLRMFIDKLIVSDGISEDNIDEHLAYKNLDPSSNANRKVKKIEDEKSSRPTGEPLMFEPPTPIEYEINQGKEDKMKEYASALPSWTEFYNRYMKEPKEDRKRRGKSEKDEKHAKRREKEKQAQASLSKVQSKNK